MNNSRQSVLTSPPAIRQENVTETAKRRLLTSHFTLHTALPAAGHEGELRMKGTQITENLIKEKKPYVTKKTFSTNRKL